MSLAIHKIQYRGSPAIEKTILRVDKEDREKWGSEDEFIIAQNIERARAKNASYEGWRHIPQLYEARDNVECKDCNGGGWTEKHSVCRPCNGDGKLAILTYEFIPGILPGGHITGNPALFKADRPEFPFENCDELSMLTYLRQISMALHALHTCDGCDYQYLHCDIKPDNLIIDRTRHKAYLIDFGISGKIEDGSCVCFA